MRWKEKRYERFLSCPIDNQIQAGIHHAIDGVR